MDNNTSREPMLDMFIFETLQLVEQIEQIAIESEKQGNDELPIDEIFRLTHTIKGSAAMMMFNGIAELSHTVEDLFYYLREQKPKNVEYSEINDILLQTVDFIKNEVAKIESCNEVDGDPSGLKDSIKKILHKLKEENNGEDNDDTLKNGESLTTVQQFYISSKNSFKTTKTGEKYRAVIWFDEGCQMENIRAFSLLFNLKEHAEVILTVPGEILDSDSACEIIKNEGFTVVFSTEKEIESIEKVIEDGLFIKKFFVEAVDDGYIQENYMRKENETALLEQQGDCKSKKTDIQENEEVENLPEVPAVKRSATGTHSVKQNMISVNISKLDILMDLVGELVISEAMVTQNSDLNGLMLENFNKAARQLQKITNELQDVVMSIRMVPLYTTFQKMNRIVRDMCQKLNKDVELEIIGEETEVDKNIIEHISDPLMHIIRNSIDHGIESKAERVDKGKFEKGKIVLEAKNSGGDVFIIVKDDGKGIDKNKILSKAKDLGMLKKSESELTDKDIFSFLFQPGFSTKEKVTEFSGRGVGMDVVAKNIGEIGGSVLLESKVEMGTTVIIKIPLTLAIVEGMGLKVGESIFTVPTTSIKESFKVQDGGIIQDPDGNELTMIRGECYPVVRLHRMYNIDTVTTELQDGIVMMVEIGDKSICLFADELIGEQQVVVKPLPKYFKKIKGLSGTTILGDGSISLILDTAGLVEN